MKCPKCGYLGFEQSERCRNCGYEFSLGTRRAGADRTASGDGPVSLDDLDLVDAAAAASPMDAPARLAVRTDRTPPDVVDEIADLPLFTDDAPLITKPSPPRPPLAVRRATPEVPKLRSDTPRLPTLSFQEPELEMPLEAPVSPAVRATVPDRSAADAGDRQTAGLGRRFAAAALDLALLAAVDLVVLYFTMQVCGLTPAELHLLPRGPLVAFLVVQNGGYLVAFTAGGQTIGKMLTGIRVVAAEPGQTVDLGRALQRTALWALMTLPFGLGLWSALLDPDRRGFHDRLAGTRVVRVVTA